MLQGGSASAFPRYWSWVGVPIPVTPNEAIIAATFVGTFAARSDAYAAFSGSNWVCVKEELTPEIVMAAFAGGPSISGYTITPQNTTHVGCIDFDCDDGLALAKQLRAAMAEKGVAGYVEMSRRGAHMWVVLDAVVPAKIMRRGLMAFLRQIGQQWAPENPKIELRPAADEIKPDGYGSPIRMPTMPNPKTGLRYPMLAADDTLIPRGLDKLCLAIDLTPAWIMESAASTVRPTMKDMRRSDRQAYNGPAVEGSASDILRTLWGALDARPNHSIRCPAHEDKVASLSILPDDLRAVCHAPSCILCNSDKGRGTYELTQLAAAKGGT